MKGLKGTATIRIIFKDDENDTIQIKTKNAGLRGDLMLSSIYFQATLEKAIEFAHDPKVHTQSVDRILEDFQYLPTGMVAAFIELLYDDNSPRPHAYNPAAVLLALINQVDIYKSIVVSPITGSHGKQADTIIQ